MSQAHMGRGARLSFVVVPQDGSVMRPIQVWKKGQGIVEKYVEMPAGFLVYFPRGHVVRIADKKALQHYNLDKDAQIVNLQGLNDPNSPLGKIMMAQDAASRATAFADLQKQVMQMAQAGSGKVELVRDPRELEAA